MRIVIIFGLYFFINSAQAQDLDQILTQTTGNETEYTTATFKSTRIINGHSIEQMKAGELDVRFSHRFGTINKGVHKLWGLDITSAHIGLDYGITSWMMAGFGRSSDEELYDGLLKFSILRQSKGARNMPISISFLTTATITGSTPHDLLGTDTVHVYFWDRVCFVNQILIARKFNERFSLEINPTFVHRNMVGSEMDPNDVLSVGFGMRFKLSKRVSFNAEYYYEVPPLHDYRKSKTYDAIAIGFDVETGGHVFQLLLTNSNAMIEKGFITETTGQWGKNDIHLGFNISRVFTLKKEKH